MCCNGIITDHVALPVRNYKAPVSVKNLQLVEKLERIKEIKSVDRSHFVLTKQNNPKYN